MYQFTRHTHTHEGTNKQGSATLQHLAMKPNMNIYIYIYFHQPFPRVQLKCIAPSPTFWGHSWSCCRSPAPSVPVHRPRYRGARAYVGSILSLLSLLSLRIPQRSLPTQKVLWPNPVDPNYQHCRQPVMFHLVFKGWFCWLPTIQVNGSTGKGKPSCST